MARSFADLPEEKRQQITDAAIREFAREDYKRASTDDIAAQAGISKGLLFYYFKNKKSLYFYLAEHLRRMVEAHMEEERLAEITDFFEMLEYGVQEKCRLFEKQPWILAFSLRMYYASDKEIAAPLRKLFVTMIDDLWETYFARMDREKFREGVEPREVLDLLICLTDGYLHQQIMRGRKIELQELLAEWDRWQGMLRQYAYKEEYQ